MQELYDDMIPGITEHQAAYAERVRDQLADVAEVVFLRPARNRDDVEAVLRELAGPGRGRDRDRDAHLRPRRCGPSGP